MRLPLTALLVLASLPASRLSFAEEKASDLPIPYPQGRIAQVNEDVILTSDVENAIRDLVPGLRNTWPNPEKFAQELAILFDRQLVSMVHDRVIDQEAHKNRITVSDAELDVRERELVEDEAGGDRERYKALIAQQGRTISTWRETLRQRMVREKLIMAMYDRAGLYVSPEDIRVYYRQHPEEFKHPERVRPRILRIVAGSPAASDRARRTAEGLRRQLDAGADFAALSRWSDPDPEQAQEEPDWRVRGDLDPALEDAVFASKPGTLIGPVAGKDGFYIARVEAREPAKVETFEEAQSRILRRLQNPKFQKAIMELEDKLLEKAYVWVGPDHLKPLFPGK